MQRSCLQALRRRVVTAPCRSTWQRAFSTTTTTGAAKQAGRRRWLVCGLGVVGAFSAGLSTWQHWDATQRRERLDGDWYVPMPLISKQAVSPDTVLLRVRTQAIENQAYPVPSCVYIKDDAIQVMRPYTPLNPNPYKDGYIDLLVKRYPNGSVSRTLAGFPVNEHIHIRGPIIEPYQYEQNSLDQIGMIAGGTGISPMYQLIRHILENDNDKRTKLWLLYANKTEDDILLKPELDALAAQHGDRFKVVYVLETPPVDWHGATGRVTPTLISSMLKNKDQEALRVFVCGPDAMLHAVCGQKPRFDTQGPISGMLGALGLSSSQVWKFQ